MNKEEALGYLFSIQELNNKSKLGRALKVILKDYIKTENMKNTEKEEQVCSATGSPDGCNFHNLHCGAPGCFISKSEYQKL